MLVNVQSWGGIDECKSKTTSIETHWDGLGIQRTRWFLFGRRRWANVEAGEWKTMKHLVTYVYIQIHTNTYKMYILISYKLHYSLAFCIKCVKPYHICFTVHVTCDSECVLITLQKNIMSRPSRNKSMIVFLREFPQRFDLIQVGKGGLVHPEFFQMVARWRWINVILNLDD